MAVDQKARRLADAQAAEVALLAVVPYAHLVAGLETCAKSGRVAYGTDNGLVLAELEHRLQGQSCMVLIYPSEAAYSGPPAARWRAIYSRQRGAVGGRHPDHDAVRPVTSDNDGAFLAFWEVLDLTELAPSEVVPMNAMRALGRKTKLPATFIPKGPLMVENPY